MPSTLWIAVAIIAVIIIRRFSRLIGSSLGLAVSLVLAGWGYWIYHQGGGIAFAGFRLSEAIFYAFVGLWVALELFELSRSLRRRRTRRQLPPTDTDADADPEDNEVETDGRE